MIQENFDEEVMEMLKADDIRASLVPGAKKTMFFIDADWISQEEPWRVQWVDPLRDNLCMVHTVDIGGEGKQYVMFVTYDPIEQRVANYVFDKDRYLTEEE